MPIFFIILAIVIAIPLAFIDALFLATGPEDEPEVLRQDRNGLR